MLYISLISIPLSEAIYSAYKKGDKFKTFCLKIPNDFIMDNSKMTSFRILLPIFFYNLSPFLYALLRPSTINLSVRLFKCCFSKLFLIIIFASYECCYPCSFSIYLEYHLIGVLVIKCTLNKKHTLSFK